MEFDIPKDDNVAIYNQSKGIGRRILNDLIKEAIKSKKSIALSVLKINQAKDGTLILHNKISLVDAQRND